jgi:hypothetical protein
VTSGAFSVIDRGQALFIAIVPLVTSGAFVHVHTACQFVVGAFRTLILVLWVYGFVLAKHRTVASCRTFIRISTTPLANPSWLTSSAITLLLVSGGGAHSLEWASDLRLLALRTVVALVALAKRRIWLGVETRGANVTGCTRLDDLACSAIVCLGAIRASTSVALEIHTNRTIWLSLHTEVTERVCDTFDPRCRFRVVTVIAGGAGLTESQAVLL